MRTFALLSSILSVHARVFQESGLADMHGPPCFWRTLADYRPGAESVQPLSVQQLVLELLQVLASSSERTGFQLRIHICFGCSSVVLDRASDLERLKLQGALLRQWVSLER